MPGLLRKLIIVAAVDGLVLNGTRQNNNGGNNDASSIRIDYKTNKISALPAAAKELPEGKDNGVEVYGVVGKYLTSTGEDGLRAGNLVHDDAHV